MPANTIEEGERPVAPVCDCLPRVREMSLARESRYRADPSQKSPEGPQSFTHVRITSTGDLNEKAESLKSGRSWVISEPRDVGGIANAPTPLEYLLSGAIGCYAAVFAFYAAKLGVSYNEFVATARAEFDKRGHVMEDAPPAGFKNVDIEIKITSDASRDELEEVQRLALKGCPGIATLRDPVPIRSEITSLETVGS